MTATMDHYRSRSIDDLAEVVAVVMRLKAALPLDAAETAILDVLLLKIDESVKAKRQATPTPLIPRARR